MPIGRLTVTRGSDDRPFWTTAEFEADRLWIRYGNTTVATTAEANIASAMPNDFYIPLSEILESWVGQDRNIAEARRTDLGGRGFKLLLVDKDAEPDSLYVGSGSLGEDEMLAWVRMHLRLPSLKISD